MSTASKASVADAASLRPKQRFKFTVNGKPFPTDDAIVTTRDVLSKAGLPFNKTVIVELTRPGSASAPLDMEHHLKAGVSLDFIAGEGDELYRFLVDDDSYDWPFAEVTETAIRDAAMAPDDKVIVFERQDERDRDLASGETVLLSPDGQEVFRLEDRLVTVTVDGDKRRIERGDYTTETLIATLKISAGYLLNVLGADGQLKTLPPGEHVRVRGGEKFVSQAPCGGSA